MVKESLKFKTAFKYPFNRAKGMLNILWMFLPIFGWLALGGYSVRIVQEFIKGKFKELPKMSFESDMELGFFMLLKSLPIIIVYSLVISVFGGIVGEGLQVFVEILFNLFMIPILGINFFKKMTIESWFEFNLIKVVFNNIGDYLIAILKSIGLFLVYLPMYLILIGIPATGFTQNIFLADFYRRQVK